MTTEQGPDRQDPEQTDPREDTGDEEVDRTLRELDARLADDDVDQVEALSEAHRRLQSRLTSPEPDLPGEAGPGPR